MLDASDGAQLLKNRFRGEEYLRSSSLVSRICRTYEASISATKQMNIRPCFEASAHTLNLSSPKGIFCSMKVFSCSSRIPYRLAVG